MLLKKLDFNTAYGFLGSIGIEQLGFKNSWLYFPLLITESISLEHDLLLMVSYYLGFIYFNSVTIESKFGILNE